jgi:hypothetical protein
MEKRSHYFGAMSVVTYRRDGLQKRDDQSRKRVARRLPFLEIDVCKTMIKLFLAGDERLNAAHFDIFNLMGIRARSKQNLQD